MEKLKKIGIDLDSTLNNLVEVWVKKYNEEYDDNLTSKKIIKWEMDELVKPECGKKIFNYLHDPMLFYNLDIKDGAKKTIDFLSKNYELYIVTAYTPDTCLDKSNWIKKHKLKINDKNVIFINNKSLLDLDYLIDDGPHNFEHFTGTGLVFDMPYNRHVNGDNLKRVKTWKDIRKFFDSEVKKLN